MVDRRIGWVHPRSALLWFERKSWAVVLVLSAIVFLAVAFSAYALRGAQRDESIGTIGWSHDFLYLTTETFRLYSTVNGAVSGEKEDLDKLAIRHELFQGRVQLVLTGSMPSRFADQPELNATLADVKAGAAKVEQAFNAWSTGGAGELPAFRAAVADFAPVAVRFYNVSRQLFTEVTTEALSERSDLFVQICILTLVAMLIAGVASLMMSRHVQRQQIARRDLAVSESRLKAILDTALVGIVSIDSDMNVIGFNRQAETIMGYKAEEIIGQPVHLLLPSDRRAGHAAKVRAFADGEAVSRELSDWRSIRGARKDGSLVPLMAVISKITIAGNLTMTIIFRDMSDAIAAEDRLARLADELKIQLEAARAANAAKSNFLAIMSHELRTPLNAIIGFSQMLGSEILGPLGSPKYKEYVGDILQSGQHLLSLINDILDLARIESRRNELRPTMLDASREVASVLDSMRPLAVGKGISVSIENNAPGAQIWCDTRALHQILINLVSNSIKFTPTGGKVTVRIDRDQSQSTGAPQFLRITVIDNGKGIPRHLIPRLGTAFFQVDSAYTRTTGGTGLGLSISKSLAENLGGSMAIESDVGVGTKVSIRLPMDRLLEVSSNEATPRAFDPTEFTRRARSR